MHMCDGPVEPKDRHDKKGQISKESFQTTSLFSGKDCIHEVVHRVGEVLPPLVPSSTSARAYSFNLDTFQQQAILCIDNGRSVLISAPTSAGKTVVAEHAVFQSLRAGLRVIYTTPVKALSNQKYKEFNDLFHDVGLITGDLYVNPGAPLLIMTTEILRSMLYRKELDVTRQINWVIFDEVHYLRNEERGVVWEETIILLPYNTGLIFLSATIPNARQFAEWIVALHHRPCHVVYTDHRPVPLKHYLFPCGDGKLHLVVDQEHGFHQADFDAALTKVHGQAYPVNLNTMFRHASPRYTRSQRYCVNLVKTLFQNHMEPVIVFSFSRKGCEHLFSRMLIDCNSEKEKAEVDSMCARVTSTLSDENKRLPQVQQLLPLLRLGVGIHHSGLLPILKEVVEILFSKGLIKVLYTTETFAVGLNMPARTVVFTNTRKFDGQYFRPIFAGEYVQMSGRAGRRGIDNTGNVVIMLDEGASLAETKQLLLSQPERLDSSFYITNNMILNFLHMRGSNPELLLEKCFYQFQNPSPDIGIRMLEAKLRAVHFPSEVDPDQLSSYVKLHDELAVAEQKQWSLVTKHKSFVSFLQPGRVVHVRTVDGVEYGWGVVFTSNHSSVTGSANSAGSTEDSNGDTTVTIDCLLQVSSLNPVCNQTADIPHKISEPIPLSMVQPISSELHHVAAYQASNKCNDVRLVSVPISCLTGLSSVSVTVSSVASVLGKMVTGFDSWLRNLWEKVDKKKKEYSGSFPLLDPVKDLQLDDMQINESRETVLLLTLKLALNPLAGRSDIKYLMDQHLLRLSILRKLDEYKVEAKNRTFSKLDDLCVRKQFLMKLGYCTENFSITLKGRIACKISTGDDILLTELLLDKLFTPLTPIQLASVMSCFIVERTSIKNELAHPDFDLTEIMGAIKCKACSLAQTAAECRLSYGHLRTSELGGITHPFVFQSRNRRNRHIDMFDGVQSYVNQFSGELIEMVRSWAKGISFIQLCEQTSAFEGDLIRCMRRLNELLISMCAAAKVAGDSELEEKFMKASELIKRDIVVAPSLYV